MEIRFNSARCCWEVISPESLILNGEPVPVFTAESLEEAACYAMEEEGWV